MIITFEKDCQYPIQNRYLLISSLLQIFEQITVEFNKVDGTFRSMTVTRNDKYLPPAAVTENHKTRAVDYSTLSAWSIEDQGWRSFKVANILSVATHNNE